MRNLRIALVLTAGLLVVEVVGGWLSGSLALLADAGHMLTDAGALGLSLLSAWIALRPANDSKTYGYQRWEILAALIFSKYFYLASLVSYYTFYLISKFHLSVQSAQIYLFAFLFVTDFFVWWRGWW